jgi:hypothetical protein
MNTIKLCVKKLTTRAGCAVFPLAIFATLGLAQQPAPQTFSSTIEASQNLLKAVQSNDEPAIEHILGGPTELTSSRDEAQDKVEREMFVQKYQEMHRLSPDADGSVTLYIGAENWPFPIPLVQRDGAWHFDADAGRKEILYRRIGENELAAIAMCHEFAANEKSYRRNPSAANPAGISPTSLVARAATGSTGGDPVLLHGYYFHILSTPLSVGTATRNGAKTAGSFTLIAYPAEYRSSGVMTFIVTEKDMVYEKDLGPTTSTIASAMVAFHKDATWIAAGE